MLAPVENCVTGNGVVDANCEVNDILVYTVPLRVSKVLGGGHFFVIATYLAIEQEEVCSFFPIYM